MLDPCPIPYFHRESCVRWPTLDTLIIPISIGGNGSIGHGMNIQFDGHHIVWFGLNSSRELFQQFNACLPRPGQKSKNVFIHMILTNDTFDMRLVDLLADRDATQDRITEAVKLHLATA
jgi:hypothetical protein